MPRVVTRQRGGRGSNWRPLSRGLVRCLGLSSGNVYGRGHIDGVTAQRMLLKRVVQCRRCVGFWRLDQLINDARLRHVEIVPVRLDDVTSCYSTLREIDARSDPRHNKYIVLDLLLSTGHEPTTAAALNTTPDRVLPPQICAGGNVVVRFRRGRQVRVAYGAECTVNIAMLTYPTPNSISPLLATRLARNSVPEVTCFQSSGKLNP